MILFVYLMIAVSQLVLRPRTPPERLRVKMWLYPVLTLLTIAGMAAVLAMMWLQTDTRSQLILSLASAAVVVVAWLIRRAVLGRSVAAPAE